MKKKILITGASGFIGSFLVEEALARNYDVYAGIRETSSSNYLKDKNIKFLILEFSDEAALQKKLETAPRFDYIIHNAGLTKANKKEDYFTVNYQYTKNFIQALIKSGRLPGKFIFISSLAAYGPGNAIDLTPVKSSDTPMPVTSYGRSKLEAEKFIYSLTNFPNLIFRPTAVYGPREKNLLILFKLINKNLELRIGSKKQHFTFIHVKDLVTAVFQGMESNSVNKSYFVTDGNVYDEKTFGYTIKRHLEKKTISLSIPTSLIRSIAATLEFVYGIAGKTPTLNLEKINELESINWQCDVKPLQDDLNFKAKYDLHSGVKDTIDWLKQEKWI